MENPEEVLIGKKSKNTINDKNGISANHSYVPRHSSNELLAEAVLIAGQPKFLVTKRDGDSISIESRINLDDKILFPLRKESYLSKAYSFSSEKQVRECIDEARRLNLSDLYALVKSFCQLFIVSDNNHLSILAADITYTYYQDRLGLTHYLFFIGKPGSGKSNNLTLINLLGYRNFMSTDITAANVYQFLGTQEPGIGTLCIDEANNIDEDRKLMEIYKTGYVAGNNRVARTDISNGRIQNAYYAFAFKVFAGERLPDGPRANGFNERIIPLHCYDGNPKYDISEVINPAGEQEYQQLLDQIENTRNLLFIHRLIHCFEPIPTVTIGLRNREKQLFISLIRMYYQQNTWTELKSVISHFISERRERQLDTLNAYLYGLIKRLTIENNSLELKSSDIWTRLKSELVGTEIPSKPLSYDTERFGRVSQTQVTKTLMEIFGAKKPRSHGDANRLIFNKEKLERVGMTYEISIDPRDGGIDGIDGNDSKYGMDVFVKDNNSMTTSDPEELDVKSNDGSEAKKDDEDSGIDGDDGDDGIDQREDNNDNKVKDLDSRSITDMGCPSSSVDHRNINSQIIETDHSLTNTNNQIRKAITTTSAHSDTNNLSQLSHLSHPPQLTTEIITRFFYDDPESLYRPLPPHKLEESPCKPIIGIDNHSFYYCALDPDVRSIHLESIEHHIKYKNGEMHKSELLGICNSLQS